MKLYLFFMLIFSFLLIKLVSSLTVTCEVGGPYGTGSTITVSGNVTGETSNVTNVTINISKSGILKVSQTTTSDSSGTYFSIFDQSFDIGNYTLNVSASNSTHTANCSDTFRVMLQEASDACEKVTISVKGVAYSKGNILNSGRLFISIEGLTARNTTIFSNGEFSISLTACLYLGDKYLLRLSVMDDEDKRGTVYIQFIPT